MTITTIKGNTVTISRKGNRAEWSVVINDAPVGRMRFQNKEWQGWLGEWNDTELYDLTVSMCHQDYLDSRSK